MHDTFLILFDTPEGESRTELRKYHRVPTEGEIVTDIGTENFYEVVQVIHRTEIDRNIQKDGFVDIYVLRIHESPRERFKRIARGLQKKPS